jgi:hypothetical protein
MIQYYSASLCGGIAEKSGKKLDAIKTHIFLLTELLDISKFSA